MSLTGLVCTCALRGTLNLVCAKFTPHVHLCVTANRSFRLRLHSGLRQSGAGLRPGSCAGTKVPAYPIGAHKESAADLVRGLLDARLSSSEEGSFGGFMEELAIFVASETGDGKKSTAEGSTLN